MLLPYGGFSDTDYPRRIAAEVRKVVDQRGLLSRASHARAEASARFDRVALSRKLGMSSTKCYINPRVILHSLSTSIGGY
jgi:hypothetical protein